MFLKLAVFHPFLIKDKKQHCITKNIVHLAESANNEDDSNK